MKVETFLGLLLLFCIYFLPTFIAFAKNRINKVSILLFNLFLGITFVFWVLALVWATTRGENTPKPQKNNYKYKSHKYKDTYEKPKSNGNEYYLSKTQKTFTQVYSKLLAEQKQDIKMKLYNMTKSETSKKKKKYNPCEFTDDKSDRMYYLDDEYIDLLRLLGKLPNNEIIEITEEIEEIIESNKQKNIDRAKEKAGI